MRSPFNSLLDATAFQRALGGSARFRENFLRLASAGIMAQALGILSLPVLTRLFDADAFGVLTTFTMLQAIMLSFAAARVDWLVPNSKSDAQARRLIAAGGLVVIAVAVATLIVLFAARAPISARMGFGVESTTIWFLPLGLLAAAGVTLFRGWFVYLAALHSVATSRLTQAVVTLLASIAFGVLAMGGFGLVLAYVIGFGAALGVLLWRGRDVISGLNRRALRNAPKVLRLYGSRLAAVTGLSIVNALMLSSLVGLILVFYGNTILGWYGLVFRLATAPISLLTTGLVSSFWADAADLVKRDPHALRHFHIKTCQRLAVVAVPITAVFALGPLYIAPIFGAEEWSGAGWVLCAVTPYLFGMIVFSPTTHLIVYDKAWWQCLSDSVTLLVSIGVFAAVATSGGSHVTAIFSSSLIMLAGYILRFFLHIFANRRALKSMTNNEKQPV